MKRQYYGVFVEKRNSREKRSRRPCSSTA